MSSKEILVAASILSADFADLAKDSQRMLNEGADWLHVDVMDGHFVPNLTIGPPVISALRKALPQAHLDCHLMIEQPEVWVKRVIDAGASSVTFHWESTRNSLSLIERIRQLSSAVQVGLAIKPGTPVESLTSALLEAVDFVLVMTVEPGFGGQALQPSCIDKVRQLRHSLNFAKRIQVDGGVDGDNARQLQDAGADIFVAGSSLFRAQSPRAVISKMKSRPGSNDE